MKTAALIVTMGLGSVSGVAALMQISDSAAWNLLNRVEDELGFSLVT